MIRRARHAGSFYPRFGEQISAKIEQWTEGQPLALESENCLGLIVPHAGYVYSGECATRGFHYISRQQYDSFIILHPCHNSNHFDYSVSDFEQYDTPLGRLDLDIQLYELIGTIQGMSSNERQLHEEEHSMEIQLPLIKYFFPDAQICPVMIGRPNPEVAARLADNIHKSISLSGKHVGIIVSTDLSHYYDAATAEAMDTRFARHIVGREVDALWQSILNRQCEACGIGGVLALLYYSNYEPESHFKLLHYTHSGYTSGDLNQVVGYLSALLYS